MSLVFEKAGLMAFEIPPAVEKTIATLEETSDVTDAPDASQSTFPSNFRVKNNIVEGKYSIAGHRRRQEANSEYFDVEEINTDVNALGSNQNSRKGCQYHMSLDSKLIFLIRLRSFQGNTLA